MTAVSNSGQLRLLPPSALVTTGDVDHADWNYKPFVGWVQRLRFKLIRKLLAKTHYKRILEIGYGSGVFMPELARYCDELYGADPHCHHEKVEAVLEKHGISASLVSAGAGELPHPENFFDCIVIVSALEFIPDLDLACAQMKRVMVPNGKLIFVTPGQSPLLDLAVKLLTGASPKDDFGDRRAKILPTLSKHFAVERRLDYPWLFHHIIRLYTAMRMKRV